MSLSAGLALIFDLDGVIIDSMPVHTEAWHVYLERLGIRVENLDNRMIGLRNDDIVRSLVGTHLTESEVFEHGAAKERLYRELMAPRIKSCLVPGVAAFLDRYGQAPMAVASNAEPANVNFVLDGAGLRRYFKVIMDGMQVQRPKPYPDVYLRAAKGLGVAPTNCIIFEDSTPGIEAARAAGARVVGVETHSPVTDVDLNVGDFRAAVLNEWLLEQRAVS